MNVVINTPSPTPTPTTTTLNAPQGTAVAGQLLSFTAIVSPQDTNADPGSLACGSVGSRSTGVRP